MEEIREAVIVALERLQRFIQEVPIEEIDRFLRGRNFGTCVLIDDWALKDSYPEPTPPPKVIRLYLAGYCSSLY